jgi:Protein of unknown function (DUF2934)
MYTQNDELPTREQIQRRAYQIYLEHGFHPGNELTDWLAAEKELTEPSEREDANTSPANVVASLRKHATA